MQEVLSVREAARSLKVSEDTVHRLIRRGAIRSTRIGRRRLLLASAINELLEEGAE